ncbi:ABC-three component system protein [Gluconobacter sp.]|uniref:ABC-three component system protein n=1 Tax=Gluconobacter sp. TaxID=1876758 RepID=UPI0039E9FDD2
MTHSASRKKAIRTALELKLRRAKGIRLQEFLTELMKVIHGDNFQPIGTDYSRGDLQCDGLLQNPLTIFACYGPVNAGANATEAAMKTAVAKVGTDFAGALKYWSTLKVWKFVHNYVEQPPAQIVQKILELRAQHSAIAIDLFGKEQFEAALLSLDAETITELVGDAASDEDFRALQPSVVLAVVDSTMKVVDHRQAPDDAPLEVPQQKLHFNGLSAHSQDRIVKGMQNAARVAKLIQDHQDPMLESDLAGAFKGKYLELKAQSLDPDDILFNLYDFSAGGHRTSAALDAAVWSLLAYLFEKCMIFEDKPVTQVAA